MNTALEHSTRVVQEGVRRCKKSTLNDLVHLTPLRIPLMNPPLIWLSSYLLMPDGLFLGYKIKHRCEIFILLESGQIYTKASLL